MHKGYESVADVDCPRLCDPESRASLEAWVKTARSYLNNHYGSTTKRSAGLKKINKLQAELQSNDASLASGPNEALQGTRDKLVSTRHVPAFNVLSRFHRSLIALSLESNRAFAVALSRRY